MKSAERFEEDKQQLLKSLKKYTKIVESLDLSDLDYLERRTELLGGNINLTRDNSSYRTYSIERNSIFKDKFGRAD